MTDLIDGLEELGYPARGAYRVLNAANYGVPQNRRRLVLMVALGSSVAFSEPTEATVTVRERLADLPPPGHSGDPLHDFPANRSEGVMAIIRRVPKDGGGRLDLGEAQLPCHTGFGGFKDVYGRMAWDRPAPTITSGCTNPSKGRFLHPEQDRAITLREAALLQGFPADYKFSLRRGKFPVATMIGNALPPPFVAAHAKQISTHLVARRVQA